MAFVLDETGTPTHGFVANISGDLSGCETIKAAVTGQSIVVESITICTVDGETVTIGQGETGGSVTTELAGPFDTGGTTAHIDFRRPAKLTAATALVVDSSGAGPNTVMVQGYVE